MMETEAKVNVYTKTVTIDGIDKNACVIDVAIGDKTYGVSVSMKNGYPENVGIAIDHLMEMILKKTIGITKSSIFKSVEEKFFK